MMKSIIRTTIHAFSTPAIAAGLLLISVPYSSAASDSIPAAKIATESKLASPGKLAADGKGSLYVVDSYKNAVRQVDAYGNQQARIKVKRPAAVAASSDGRVYIGSHRDYSVGIYKNGALTGHLASDKNEFASISDIAVDQSTGDVYVADAKAHLVKVYSLSGTPKTRLSGFRFPSAVFVTDSEVYVLDEPIVPCPETTAGNVPTSPVQGECSALRIAKLDKKGTLVAEAKDSGEEQMIRPVDIAVDEIGNLYVADAGRKAVLAYSGSGSFIGSFSSPLDELRVPVSVAAGDGHLFVSSSETAGIVKITLSGPLRETSNCSLEFKSKTGSALPLSALGY